MTNSWTDIANTDLVIIMGGNAAEAHPCGFKWVTEAKHHRGAKLIVVDPKMVEFGIYNGVPHLLIPVVTDAKRQPAPCSGASPR